MKFKQPYREISLWRSSFTGITALCLIAIPLLSQAADLPKANSNADQPAVTGSFKPSSPAPVMIPIPGKKYELGKYEVTQAEWKAVMGNNPSKFNNCGDSCPVEQVNWDDVQTFIQKLNTLTGNKYRLPTEGEWEGACLGEKQTEYCGSDDVDSVAWYADNSDGTTHPVGQKQPNGYGLYDMSGNVSELTSDCNNGDCEYHLVRGGSWLFILDSMDVTSHSVINPTARFEGTGFRLARTLP